MGPFTIAEPLGPVDHANVSRDAQYEIIDHSVAPFTEAVAKSAILIYGRKGAGKSALLSELKREAGHRARPSVKIDRLPAPGQAFIVSVLSWQHFSKMIMAVDAKHGVNEVYADLVPVEQYTDLWLEVVWNEIIEHFYDYAHFPTTRSALSAVSDYVNGETRTQMPPLRAAAALFEDAKNQILSFLDHRNSDLFILFDSMDNYPVKNDAFAKILTGFFQAIKQVNYASPRINVTFCIPEEIEPFLNSISTNILKDFSSAHRIKWRPIELLQIVAHRYRLSIKDCDEDYYKEIENLDFANRVDIHRLFSRMLPETITNCLGETEDCVAYIMRHTQLLPRHIIYIFNILLARSYAATGGIRYVPEKIVVEGIKEAEDRISDQILTPYQRIYPSLIEACSTILAEINPICPYKTLKGAENRFNNRVDDGCFSVWQTLFEMGILGKTVTAENNKRPSYIRSSRYSLAEFKFNSSSSNFTCALEDEVCFHPVFSRRFGMRRSDIDEKRAVYPAGVDIIAISQ